MDRPNFGDAGTLIEPFYPKGETAGHPPLGLERLLRIYFLQHWFSRSDPAVKETLFGSNAMHRFLEIDIGSVLVPDWKSVRMFRHLLAEK